MIIKLSNAGKRFNRDWIFRKASLEFNTPGSYAITGPNGSGKSTLLQVLSGHMAVSEGTVEWLVNDRAIDEEKVHQYIAIAAPYIDVIEEMTAVEFLQFHQKFKAFMPGISTMDALSFTGLANAAHKQVRYYSSGMKQRIKLAQAFFSNVPLLLLDEPTTNLDAEGISLYQQLIEKYTTGKIVIVCSNDEVEYAFCQQKISIQSYK